jgi:hypothetical protein
VQREIRPVKLTGVEVDKPQHYWVKVGGNFGGRRVVYEIPREPLDDYFSHRQNMTDLERHTLVTNNVAAITLVMQRKCEQQAWSEVNRGVGSFWLLDFDPRDVETLR